MTVSHQVQVAECKLFLPAGRVHEGTVPGGAVCPVTAGAFAGDLSRG